ncbi:MAG TPA: hypothetical protein PL155_07800 [Candidatus Omnitrophota bacterium]|nr:hypothetical protein [Candidatus Omnitrophota bacterium]HPD85263.1 hypothetical protein [Candidatus Omnitrophota bacterium]HRZ04236.1 hypothetical protein [Candidatus Omnitrophota bacterium]
MLDQLYALVHQHGIQILFILLAATALLAVIGYFGSKWFDRF